MLFSIILTNNYVGEYITITLHAYGNIHLGHFYNGDDYRMKNLLNYQTSEYDCGPVTLLNGIRYLFDREEIYPDMVKFIMLYCMDSYNEAGEICKRGTSPAAMNYIASWLNHFSEVKKFPLHCDFIQVMTSFLNPAAGLLVLLKRAVLYYFDFFWKCLITFCSPILRKTGFCSLIRIMRKRMIPNLMRNIKLTRFSFSMTVPKKPTVP